MAGHRSKNRPPPAERSPGGVRSPDGVEIRYETAGRGEPALVFVHGWCCDRSYWRAQVDHFASRHLVVALDLGGHGESGLGRRVWSMSSFGADVSAVVEKLDLHDVVLVGHSMGGPVVVEAARLLEDRVLAVVPVDYFGDVEDRWSAERVEAYLAPLRADFPGTTRALVRRYFRADSDPKLVERVARDMAAQPPDVGLSAIEHVRRYDQAEGLAAVKVPVRLINGDLWNTDVEAARRYRPDLKLAVMSGVGHFIMVEKPDEFNRLLERTVRKLADPRTSGGTFA